MASRTRIDFNPLFFRLLFLGLSFELSFVPFRVNVSSTFPGRFWIEEFSLVDQFWNRDCMYAAVPPATRTPATATSVLLLKK